MCGIAAASGLPADEARLAVEAMCEQMVARGPDDEGVEVFAAGAGDGGRTVALGSRRLAIIDPSPAGHQPMSDPARGTTIVFNGMIYNFRELRDRLIAEGESFASRSDTEVVLKAYARWGHGCVRHLRGMFAFCIWDARADELFLARDRLGIKPLYHAHDGDRLLLASQVKALLATGLVAPRLSLAGLRTYLAYGAVSEPLTAIEGISALPAGHTGVFRSGRLTIARYWQPPTEPELSATKAEAVEELRTSLEDVIRGHLVSDAPLGIFLSGGVDSSVLAAIAARHTDALRTVSVVFDDPALSEQSYMNLVAAHVGSDHVEVDLRPADLLGWLDEAFAAMDQPSFDAINTYAVSRAAATTGLKVALSGLGADELFDGYGYVRRVTALEWARRLPATARDPARRAAGLMDGRAAKLQTWLSDDYAPGSSYDLLRRVFLPGEAAALVGGDGLGDLAPAGPSVDLRRDVFRQVSALDLANYTKNVLLRDTDAMSMAHSLEVRVPFLDHELVEWTLRLPASAKVGRRRKELLLAAVQDLLPREILRRRKQGFVVPLARWLRGELRGEADARLQAPPAAVAELLDPRELQQVWTTFLRDGRRWLRPWALFALSSWTGTLSAARAPARP